MHPRVDSPLQKNEGYECLPYPAIFTRSTFYSQKWLRYALWFIYPLLCFRTPQAVRVAGKGGLRESLFCYSK